MNYTIYITSPGNYPHSETFREVAEGLQEGFAELGYVVPIVTDPQKIQGRAIVFGANIQHAVLPADAIIFNLEQAGTGWMTEPYLHLLRNREVWDYDPQNIKELQKKGVKAKYCGIGYEPCLTRIAPQEEDIDVLFYGSIFGDRIQILEAIEKTGLKVQRLFGVYGAARDEYIARSKIVLNLHAYENAPFEIVRVSYLWANQKFIISEGLAKDIGVGIVYGAPNDLPTLCIQYAQDPTARRVLARRGFEQFTKTRQSEYLKDLLALTVQSPRSILLRQ